MQRDRAQVLEWKEKLLELSRLVESKHPNEMMASFRAFDVALLETAIYGLIAQGGPHHCRCIVEATLNDILSTNGDPEHWRNREA